MAQLFSLKTSLAAVSAAFFLTACGGGSGADTKVVIQDIPSVALSPSTVTEAKALATALVGTSVPLPTGQLFGDTGPSLASGTSLTFTALPAGAPANAVAGLSITGGTDNFTGYISAGSTYFCGSGTLGGVVYPATTPVTCFKIEGAGLKLDVNTAGLTGDTTSFNVAVVIESVVGITQAQGTIAGTVAINQDGSFAVLVGGEEVGSGETIEVTGGN